MKKGELIGIISKKLHRSGLRRRAYGTGPYSHTSNRAVIFKAGIERSRAQVIRTERESGVIGQEQAARLYEEKGVLRPHVQNNTSKSSRMQHHPHARNTKKRRRRRDYNHNCPPSSLDLCLLLRLQLPVHPLCRRRHHYHVPVLIQVVGLWRPGFGLSLAALAGGGHRDVGRDAAKLRGRREGEEGRMTCPVVTRVYLMDRVMIAAVVHRAPNHANSTAPNHANSTTPPRRLCRRTSAAGTYPINPLLTHTNLKPSRAAP